MLRLRTIIICTVLCFGATAAQTSAVEIIEFWNDAEGWKSGVESHTFIDFTDWPHGTVMTNQIPGLTFTTFVFIHSAQSYSDGYGLLGTSGVRIEFDVPQQAIGIDHLGHATFALYFKGDLIAMAPACSTCPFPASFGYPSTGVHFSGIISDSPFDEIYFFKPQPPHSTNNISIDNLYWAMPIPAPGALPVLALAFFLPRRCRLR